MKKKIADWRSLVVIVTFFYKASFGSIARGELLASWHGSSIEYLDDQSLSLRNVEKFKYKISDSIPVSATMVLSQVY